MYCLDWLNAVSDLAKKSPLLVCAIGLGLLSAVHIARVVIAISTFFVELLADDLFDCWIWLKKLRLAAMPWRRHAAIHVVAHEEQKHVISSGLNAPTLCTDGLEVVKPTGTVERENEVLLPIEAPARRTSRLSWMATAAAALVALVLAGVWMQASRKTHAMKTLVARTPTMHRNIEPRLTGGFPWAPLVAATRGGQESFDPEQMKFIGAAGDVLEQTAGDDSIEAQHAAALAHLVARRTSDALAILKNLSTRTADAYILSDLGAALYTDALERGGSARFAPALAATDRALRVDSRLPEALFNRALILEHLGMRREACSTWERYIAIDSQAAWRGEAAGRLRMLASEPEDGHELRRQYDQAPGSPPSANGNRVLQPTLYAAAQSAAFEANWTEALYLLGLALDRPPAAGAEASTAQMLVMRAHIEIRIGLPAAARTDIARAKPIIDRIVDPSARERAVAACLTIEAALAPSPASAIRLLDGPLGSHGREGTVLAQMYLQRGRSFAVLGYVDRAYADFEAGIRHLDDAPETHATLSWETATTREELFDEGVALAMSRGDGSRAFAYAQRARTPHSAALTESSLSGDRAHIFIEYKVLRDHLAIFVAKDGRLRAVQIDVRSEVLSAEVDQLTYNATLSDATWFRRAASTLYDRLLAPVTNELENGRTLVIVPDASLNAVPFSALVGPNGRYVVEDHPVVIAPSATAYARLATRPRASAARPLNLLLIAGPSRHDAQFGRLFSAQREVDAVASAYGLSVNRISSDGSTFEARAVRASIIHVAGHAVSSGNAQPALLMSDRNGNPERLEARDIEAMDLRNTHLVVLSACRSGVGEEAQTSLARAFITAGAPAVVGTLWDIEDRAASSFFPRLHRYLAQGASPADALRAAQLDCIRRRDIAPKMWAAVQVIESGLRRPTRQESL